MHKHIQKINGEPRRAELKMSVHGWNLPEKYGGPAGWWSGLRLSLKHFNDAFADFDKVVGLVVVSLFFLGNANSRNNFVSKVIQLSDKINNSSPMCFQQKEKNKHKNGSQMLLQK